MAEESPLPLLHLALRNEQDVVLCRNRARTIAGILRFEHQDQIRIAAAVSEIARNAFQYGKQATADFGVQKSPPSKRGVNGSRLICTVTDRGSGIANLQEILSGRRPSPTGAGMGITSAHRLMDDVSIQTGPSGTSVALYKNLPASGQMTFAQIQEMVCKATANAPVDPLAELTIQNDEMLRTLDEVTVQREELSKINEELSETNRGVVALYDELDTVHQVGRVLATKLDLESLIQAITEATTDISGAEIGLFFHLESPKTGFVLKSKAGALKDAASDITVSNTSRLFAHPDPTQILRVNDLLETGLNNPFPPHSDLRSLLTVPIFAVEAESELAGALVFAHRKVGAFTERSERILATVAVQASIGLDNARLYRNVRAASAAKDQFIAALSHELRTPLTPALAILSSLCEDPGHSPALIKDLETVRQNLELEARLIDDLLDLTRIANGKLELRYEETSVVQIVDAAIATCLADMEARHLTLRRDYQHQDTPIFVDGARLTQILWNLLKNAIKFTPSQGSITVSSRTTAGNEGAQVKIEVQDTGAGIEAANLTRIFDAFEQGDRQITRQFGGLGLGLAISKAIAEAHHGSLSATSAGRDLGSTFTLSLPVPAHHTGAASPFPLRSAPSPAVGQRRPLRILLVEDHDDTADILIRLLAGMGHEILHTSTIQTSLETAQREMQAKGLDLVVSDLGLPDGSGLDLMRQLHTAYQLRGIALSGYGMDSDIRDSTAAGFSHHLTKPINVSILRKTMDEMMTSI